MKELAYYDGEIGTPDEVKVPFNDRVHFFGDGVYDATVGGNHKVYLLKDHLDRFYSSAAALDIKIPMEKEALGKLLAELLEQVEGQTHFVYWQVTRGAAERNHVYSEDMEGKLWILIRPNRLKDPDQPIRLITREDTRFYHCNIKTLNLIPNVMAAQRAKEEGCGEAVFHRGDRVTECAHSNCHILKGGRLITAPADHLILPGIARAHLIRMCEKLEIPVDERPFTVAEMMGADEVLVTSSSKFCLSAGQIDGIPVGGKAAGLLERLQSALEEEFLRETEG